MSQNHQPHDDDRLNLINQLRQVLVSAEKQSFDLEGCRRQLDAEHGSVEKLEKVCAEKTQQLAQAEKKNSEIQLFAQQQKDHICRLQRTLEDEKKVRCGFESSIKALNHRVSELTTQLKGREAEATKTKQALEELRKSKQDKDEALNKSEAELSLVKSNKEKELTQLRKRCLGLQSQLQKAHGELERSEGQMKNALALVATVEEREAKLNEQQSELSKKFEVQLATINENQTTIQALQQRCELAEKDLNKERSRAVEMDKTREALRTQLEAVLEQKQHDESTQGTRIIQLQNRVQMIEREKQAQKQELERLLSQVGKDIEGLKAARVAELKKEREDHTNNVKGLNTRMETLKQGIAERQSMLELKSGEIKQLHKERNTLRSQVELLVQKLKQSEQGIRGFKTQLTKNNQDREKIEKEAARKFHTIKTELAKSQKFRDKLEKQMGQLELDASNAVGESKRAQADLEQAKKQWRAAEATLNTHIDEARSKLAEEIQRRQTLEGEFEQQRRASQAKLAEQKTQLQQLYSTSSKEIVYERDQCEKLKHQLDAKTLSHKELEQANINLLKEIREVQHALQEKEQSLETVSDELEKLSTSHRKRQADLEAVKEDSYRKQQEASMKQQQQAKMYQEQLRNLTKDFETTKRKLTSQTDHASAVEAELQRLQQNTAGQIVGFNEKSKTLLRDNEHLRSEIAQLEAKVKLAIKKETASNQAVAEQRQEVEKLKRETSERIAKLEAELRETSREKATKEMELVKLQQDCSEQNRKLSTQAQTEREELQNAMEGVRWKADSLQRETDELKSENASILDKLRRLQRQNEELKENEANLISLYKNMANQNVDSLEPVANERVEESHSIPGTTNTRTKLTKKKKKDKRIKQSQPLTVRAGSNNTVKTKQRPKSEYKIRRKTLEPPGARLRPLKRPNNNIPQEDTDEYDYDDNEFESGSVTEEDDSGPDSGRAVPSNQVFRSVPDFIKFKKTSSQGNLTGRSKELDDEQMNSYLNDIFREPRAEDEEHRSTTTKPPNRSNKAVKQRVSRPQSAVPSRR